MLQYQNKENSLERPQEVHVQTIALLKKTAMSQGVNFLPDEELCATNHRFLGLLMWCPTRVWRVLGLLESSLSVSFDRTHLPHNCTTWCRAQALKTMWLTTLDLATNYGNERNILANAFCKFECNTTLKYALYSLLWLIFDIFEVVKQSTPTKDHG